MRRSFLCSSRRPRSPFAAAIDLLAPLFADLLRRHPTDAVVFDGVLPWAATTVAELGMSQYAFIGMGCFTLSVQRSLLLHTPQERVASPMEPFLVSGLHDAVRLTRLRLAEATLPGTDSREFLNRMFDIGRATVGWSSTRSPTSSRGTSSTTRRLPGSQCSPSGGAEARG